MPVAHPARIGHMCGMDKLGIKTSEFAVTVGVLALCALLGIVALLKGHDVAAAVSVAVAVAKALGYDWSRASVKTAALNLASAEATDRAVGAILARTEAAARASGTTAPSSAAAMVNAVTTVPDHPPVR